MFFSVGGSARAVGGRADFGRGISRDPAGKGAGRTQYDCPQ